MGTSTHTVSQLNRAEMRRLEQSINNNLNGTNAAARNQRYDDIVRLGMMLNKEGNIYPKLTEVYEWEANAYEDELRLSQTRAIIKITNCHAKALEAGRKALELHLRCTGRDSQQVKATLAWLVGLGGR